MPSVRYHLGRFPPEERIDWAELIPNLGPAAAALARHDGALSAIPNPRVLLMPLTTREAVLSSRIEGAQATLVDVLRFEAGREPDSPARRDDIREILNYRSAMCQAEESLKNLPLSQRVVREAHEILLRGTRGQGKSPGEYRRIPNWIGPPGCSLEEARFVPVEANRLPDAMGAWERYIHAEAPDKLVQLAILHAEFEAPHSFLDGSGRVGRLLMPMFLWQVGLIRAPMFCISAYFEGRRDAYYDSLLAVSRDDDWTDWCRFFLDAVTRQAEDNLTMAERIMDLYNTMKGRIIARAKSQYAIFALDWIFERPIFRSSDFVSQPAVPASTARRILNVLRTDGILVTPIEGRGRQAAILSFPSLLHITEGNESP